MYKLLIVDDEPLVQVGIKSMLDWGKLNIEVAGTASGGRQALELIEEQLPDIVITDIKMPVMDGLELIRQCRQKYGNERPFFIILTSYEDFHMVKEALTYQVTDYLVKLELTPETLGEAIGRVTGQLQASGHREMPAESIVHPFFDKFFIKLLNNLFESQEQFQLQSRDLNLDFHFGGYVCCYGEMTGRQADALPPDRQLALFASSMQMLKELAAKYGTCFCLSLDTRHFALVFCYEQPGEDYRPDRLQEILENIRETLAKYYNVSFRCGIGNLVDNPLSVCDSYQYSRQALLNARGGHPIVHFEDSFQDAGHNSFNISLFKEDLTRAFEEYDAGLLARTFDTLCELFLAHPNHYVQALDGACNILFLSLSLLQDGEEIVNGFYRDTPDGYRSIYKQTNVEQVANWLTGFGSHLCQLFESHHKDYKNRIVTNVKKYINQHVTQRLTLNEVAAVFGISPNYLSQLFGRYSDVGFSEYINNCRIAEAKRLLDEGGLKVYEVAEMLGYESSFYFSKVFKKVEGISPSDYQNKLCLQPAPPWAGDP